LERLRKVRYRQGPDHKLYPIDEWYEKFGDRPSKVHHIMTDIAPYKAVGGDITGKMITSRSKEREYLRRNNFEQVGNEWNHFSKYGGKTPDNPTREW
jgi:hypothetical protein